MCLIGNDLLYINTNYTTFSRKGAAKIILNKFETDTFFFEDKNSILPIIWTIKESVYKITCKQGNNNAFTPSNIKILTFNKTNNNIYGNVNFENQNYFFRTIVKQNYIFSYATTNKNNFQNIKHHFFKNNAINNKSINNVEFIKFIKSQNWNLVHSENGIPKIKNENNIDISISHDYNMLALSYLKNH